MILLTFAFPLIHHDIESFARLTAYVELLKDSLQDFENYSFKI